MNDQYVGPAYLAYRRFKTDPCDEYAMVALSEIAAIGKPIPADLVPYIPKACAAWQAAKGNRQRVRTKTNADTLEAAIAWVAFYKRHHHMIIDDAAAEVTKIWPKYSIEYLLQEYRRGSSKPYRDRANDAAFLLDTAHLELSRRR